MNEGLLTQIGLNSTQAKAYLALVRHGPLTPPQLAKKTGETRTNAYAVLDRLVELGLAKKTELKSKLVYRVENPVALENLVRQDRDAALARERLIQNSMPMLLSYFYTYSEQPGVRFYQGVDGIKKIYSDTLRTGKDIHLLRSLHDQDVMPTEFYRDYTLQRASLGIKTYMLNPIGHKNSLTDRDFEKLNITHAEIPAGAYAAPVEINIYGDKVALISFGQEIMGTIIESPQIAQSMQQLLDLAWSGAHKAQASAAQPKS